MNDLQAAVLVLVAIALGAMVGYAYGWRAGQQEAIESFRGTFTRRTYRGR